ncbi:MAG: hypothetical protein H6704_17400 [Myxococcales bacterium]|nr:hypothetical protein [Myxococcales bacterium]
MRPLFLIAALLGVGCSDDPPVAPLMPARPPGPDAAPRAARRAPRPVPATCNHWLPELPIAGVFGQGSFHIEAPRPGGRLAFDCEWRAPTPAGQAPTRVVQFQGACGEAGARLRAHVWPRADGVAAIERPALGVAAAATTATRLGDEPQVRLVFESMVSPGCVVRVEVPGDLKVALRVGHAIERALARYRPDLADGRGAGDLPGQSR